MPPLIQAQSVNEVSRLGADVVSQVKSIVREPAVSVIVLMFEVAPV